MHRSKPLYCVVRHFSCGSPDVVFELGCDGMGGAMHDGRWRVGLRSLGDLERPDMTRAQAIDKVKKLLRLGKSSNMHEAAAAMRQAQSLMRHHALDEQELHETQPDDTAEVATAARRGRKPPIYALILADSVCAAFGVLSLVSGNHAWRVLFFGPAWRAQIAEYAFTVLLRQLERDRRTHLNRVRVAKNRLARGDMFGIGWAKGAAGVLSAWDMTDDDRAKAAALIGRNYPLCRTETFRARSSPASKSLTHNDHAMGRAHGSKARLDRGVGVSQKAIEGPR
jgi:hypothetical protein